MTATRRRVAWVMILAAWVTGGCVVFRAAPETRPASGPTPIDVSLLTGEPCEPPCWQGLVAGVSTEEEIERFLTSSGLVNRSSVYRGTLSRGGKAVGVSIQWLSTANVEGAQSRNSFHVEDGVLQAMTICLDAEVSLAELTDRYGAPDKYVAVPSGIHFTSVRATLFYPEHGFTARVEVPLLEQSLWPDTRVLSVWYFKAAPLESFLEFGRDIGHFSATVQPEALSDWHGYGPIEVD